MGKTKKQAKPGKGVADSSADLSDLQSFDANGERPDIMFVDGSRAAKTDARTAAEIGL